MMRNDFARYLPIGLLLAVLFTANPAQARDIVHEVKKGQNLGMIAKRYHTTAKAIRKHNDLSIKRHIYPGQKLRVVETDEHRKWLKFYAEKLDPKRNKTPEKKEETKKKKKSQEPAGSTAQKPAEKKEKRSASKRSASKRSDSKRSDSKRSASKRSDSKRSKSSKSSKSKSKRSESKSQSSAPKRSAKTKRRAKTQRSARATKDSQRAANKVKRATSKSAAVTTSRYEDNGSAASKYMKAPRKRGLLTLTRFGRRFRGTLVDDQGQVRTKTAKRVDRFMRSWRTGEKHEIDRRLYRLLAQVSDHFGGRKIVIVSGYRPYRDKQFTKNSRHNHGQAIDFRVVGVPNRALFDYCKGFNDVGCGFYPNSAFVHMDVRKYKTQWTDYSRPGQKPIYAHKRKRRATKKTSNAAGVASKKKSRKGGAERKRSDGKAGKAKAKTSSNRKPAKSASAKKPATRGGKPGRTPTKSR